MSLTVRDVHTDGPLGVVPGRNRHPRVKRREDLIYKAFPFGGGGGQPLSEAQHQQRVNAARSSAQHRRKTIGGNMGKLGRYGLMGESAAGALASMGAGTREERFPGVTDRQERFARIAGHVGSGLGGLVGGLAGSGIASIPLGIAGSTAGQQLFERGALALFADNKDDAWERFKAGNRDDTPGAGFGTSIGGTAASLAGGLLNRSTPGRYFRAARDIGLEVGGSLLGAEAGRHLEGEGSRWPELAIGGATALGAGLLINRRRSAFSPRVKPEQSLPKILSREGAGAAIRVARQRIPGMLRSHIPGRFFKSYDPSTIIPFTKSNLSEAEIEQRRNAARARWANHSHQAAAEVEAQPPRTIGQRARDNAVVLGLGALALGAGIAGLLLTRKSPKPTRAMRTLMARAERSQLKSNLKRFDTLNAKIGSLKEKLATDVTGAPKHMNSKQRFMDPRITDLPTQQARRRVLEENIRDSYWNEVKDGKLVQNPKRPERDIAKDKWELYN